MVGVHVGNMIKQVLREQGLSVNWLAKQIPCDRTNMYRILQKAHIDTYLLLIISQRLRHDFFAEFSTLSFPQTQTHESV
jgi:hypothetical protein